MNTIRVFCSYSKNDDAQFLEFGNQIASIKDQIPIEPWDFRQNKAGDDYQTNIDNHIQKADVIVLLLSSNFLASDECKKEMRIADKRRREENITVVPILLTPCGWKEYSELKILQVIPKDAKPINDKCWESKEHAWENVRKEFSKKIKEIHYASFPQIKDDFKKFLKKVEYLDERGTADIDKLFVSPKLAKATDIENQKERDYKNLIVEDSTQRCLIYGENLSGKTILAKKMFLDCYQRKSIPLYIDGKHVKKAKSQNILNEVFKHQYDAPEELEKYLSNNNIHLIIDDFDRLSEKQQKELLETEMESVKSIICFGQEDEYLISCNRNNQFSKFEIFSIKKFGKVKQRDCIKNWLRLKGDDEDHYAEDKLLEAVSRVFSSQLMPAYPYFIYSVLQVQESFMPSNMKITRYGHAFQAFIYARLYLSDVPQAKIDYHWNFYTQFAFNAFHNEKCVYSKNELLEYISSYSTGFQLPTENIEDFFTEITSLQKPIVKKIGHDEYFFGDEYVYYFFLGRHIASHLDETLISTLCKNIYKRDCSFSLIFAVHHSMDHAKNRGILDEVIIRGMCHYDKIDEETLGSIDESASNIDHETRIDPQKNPEQEREKRASMYDDADSRANLMEKELEDIADQNEVVKDMMTCIKTMEILGQIAKNHSGSLPKNRLLEIVDTSISMGLRFLSFLLREIDFRESARIHLESRKQILTDEKINRLYVLFKLYFSYIVVNKISYEIASDESLNIIDAVCKDENLSPARQVIKFISHIRVNRSMRSDNRNSSRLANEVERLIESLKDKHIAKTIVKIATTNHVHTHKIAINQKQRLIEIINPKKKEKKEN